MSAGLHWSARGTGGDASTMLADAETAATFTELWFGRTRGASKCQARTTPVDVILGMSSLALAELRTDIPVTLWADATFAALTDFYPEFVRLSKRQLRLGHAVDAAAMHRCAAVFFASKWAARSAQTDSGLAEDRIVLAPFGANLGQPPSAEEVGTAIRARDGEQCRLVTIGVDWARKRADVAVSAVAELRRSGINATLTVIGTDPYRERGGGVRSVRAVRRQAHP